MAEYSLIVSPSDFDTSAGITVLIYVVVGGVESFWGPLIGALVVTAITTQLGQYQSLVEYTPLVQGVILIAVVLLFPGGLVSIPKLVSDLSKRAWSRPNMDSSDSGIPVSSSQT